MKKIEITNLGMIITEKCNLKCAHCMRGTSSNKSISQEVIAKTLDQIIYTDNLAICGGEPLLALQELEKIITYVVDNHILIGNFTTVINGTIYNEEFLHLLNYINSYIKRTEKKDEVYATFMISHDLFHYAEILNNNLKNQYLENIHQYAESPYFAGLKKIEHKLFNEGRATSLDKSLTVPNRPMKTYMTYTDNNYKLNKENGLCLIGPIVTVNVNGILTDCNTSIINQQTLYNYGNILTDTIENIFLKNNTPILKPKSFQKKIKKELKHYNTYNK